VLVAAAAGDVGWATTCCKYWRNVWSTTRLCCQMKFRFGLQQVPSAAPHTARHAHSWIVPVLTPLNLVMHNTFGNVLAKKSLRGKSWLLSLLASHKHTPVRACEHACFPASQPACLPVMLCACACMCTHTHKQTLKLCKYCTHTHTRTHTHVHVYHHTHAHTHTHKHVIVYMYITQGPSLARYEDCAS